MKGYSYVNIIVVYINNVAIDICQDNLRFPTAKYGHETTIVKEWRVVNKSVSGGKTPTML